MANSSTLPFTIYNMIISTGYCVWIYDWLLESILGSYSAFMLKKCYTFLPSYNIIDSIF